LTRVGGQCDDAPARCVSNTERTSLRVEECRLQVYTHWTPSHAPSESQYPNLNLHSFLAQTCGHRIPLPDSKLSPPPFHATVHSVHTPHYASPFQPALRHEENSCNYYTTRPLMRFVCLTILSITTRSLSAQARCSMLIICADACCLVCCTRAISQTLVSRRISRTHHDHA